MMAYPTPPVSPITAEVPILAPLPRVKIKPTPMYHPPREGKLDTSTKPTHNNPPLENPRTDNGTNRLRTANEIHILPIEQWGPGLLVSASWDPTSMKSPLDPNNNLARIEYWFSTIVDSYNRVCIHVADVELSEYLAIYGPVYGATSLFPHIWDLAALTCFLEMSGSKGLPDSRFWMLRKYVDAMLPPGSQYLDQAKFVRLRQQLPALQLQNFAFSLLRRLRSKPAREMLTKVLINKETPNSPQFFPVFGELRHVYFEEDRLVLIIKFDIYGGTVHTDLVVRDFHELDKENIFFCHKMDLPAGYIPPIPVEPQVVGPAPHRSL
jgi:hypothetical protein